MAIHGHNGDDVCSCNPSAYLSHHSPSAHSFLRRQRRTRHHPCIMEAMHARAKGQPNLAIWLWQSGNPALEDWGNRARKKNGVCCLSPFATARLRNVLIQRLLATATCGPTNIQSGNLAIWQSGQSKAKLQTARGTIFVSPATGEGWGVACSPRGPGQPRVSSVAKSSPACPPPPPPPPDGHRGGHRAVGHPPASLPGNKRTHRRTKPTRAIQNKQDGARQGKRQGQRQANT